MKRRLVNGPPGWRSGGVERRFASGGPRSYNADSHTCECKISVGTGVQRWYGTEKLRISKSAIDVSRVQEGGVPVLNSHNGSDIKNILGRIVTTWISGGALWGKIQFADTKAGREAEAMVSRGELRSVSAGYSVEKWSVEDANGRAVDPEDVQAGDAGLTFWAESWTLYEVSLVAIPADQSAGIRSMSIAPLTSAHVVKARMQARARMYARESAHWRQGVRS